MSIQYSHVFETDLLQEAYLGIFALKLILTMGIDPLHFLSGFTSYSLQFWTDLCYCQSLLSQSCHGNVCCNKPLVLFVCIYWLRRNLLFLLAGFFAQFLQLKMLHGSKETSIYYPAVGMSALQMMIMLACLHLLQGWAGFYISFLDSG